MTICSDIIDRRCAAILKMMCAIVILASLSPTTHQVTATLLPMCLRALTQAIILMMLNTD